MTEPAPDEIPALSAAAKAAGGPGPGPEANRLWAAVFRMPQWHFLMSPKRIETFQPSVQLIEQKPWLLVFTNGDLLQRYAVTNRNLDAAGNALFVSIPNANVLPYLEGFRAAGVFGVRFNEGDDDGFYAPLTNLAAFPRYLREKGFLPRGQS